MKFSAANVKIGQYLNPVGYREVRRIIENNQAIICENLYDFYKKIGHNRKN